MAKLKEDFVAATRERQLRFAANIAEEMGEAGKSDRKIREYLEKIGADSDLINEAVALAEDEGLEEERSRAKRIVADLIGGENPDPKTVRKVLSKLAYQGFNEEIIYEIAEGFDVYV